MLELEAPGYGAGSYDLDPYPNVLRALVGAGEGSLVEDDIAVLERNPNLDAMLDVLGGLQETLADAGRVLFRFCRRR